MPQYDCIMRWNTEAAALADVITAGHWQTDLQAVTSWMQDHVIPNIQVWRKSQDVIGSVIIDGITVPTVTHTYLPGWFALVSVSHRVPEIENSPALQLAIDRDKMNAGAPASQYVLASTLTLPLLADFRCQPIYLGMNVPWVY